VAERIAGTGPSLYRFTADENHTLFKLRYRGSIKEPLKLIADDYGDVLEGSAGLITREGAFLGGSSFWYPVTAHYSLTFSMRTHLPAGWRSVSQGRALGTSGQDGWEELSPQDEIYLIAGRFQRYTAAASAAEAQVYLRQPDEELAGRYLQATAKYLDLYSDLLGPYPYQKFALVENFWESGEGMPSFTLLGPKVIRLPFILHSSYPHEILHNWWGNSVYVDYANGNWSEGLTSYLADHLIKEQQGLGSSFRRDVLQRYADYVAGEEDFPLNRFLGPHGQTSRAVGYGRAMMFFHMLSEELGDTLFREGLRRFYRDNRFKTAGYRELQQAFENTAGTELSGIFRQWTTRVGAPALKISELAITRSGNRYLLEGVLQQVQNEQPFRLRVPIGILLQGEEQPRLLHVDMTRRKQRLRLEFEHPPLWLSVDPLFDLFRQLDPGEIPSSVGQLFGSEKLTLVLPSSAPAQELAAYQKLARAWAARHAGIEILWDKELRDIPNDGMVWLFGRHNSLAMHFLALTSEQPLQLEQEHLQLGDRSYSLRDHSFAVTGRSPHTVGWISAHASDLVPLLARKLPHYGKYSYLVFNGEDLRNVGKGQWPLTDSALTVRLPAAGDSRPLPPPEHSPLTDLISP
jgi:hypothetical protein